MQSNIEALREALEAATQAVGGLAGDINFSQDWLELCRRLNGSITPEEAAYAYTAWESIKVAAKTDDLRQILALVHKEEHHKDFSATLAAFRSRHVHGPSVEDLLEGFNNWERLLRGTSDSNTVNDIVYDLGAWEEVTLAARSHDPAEIVAAVEGWDAVKARAAESNPKRLCVLIDCAVDGWKRLCAEIGHPNLNEFDTVINKVLEYKKKSETNTLSPEDQKALALGRAMLEAIPAPKVVHVYSDSRP